MNEQLSPEEYELKQVLSVIDPLLHEIEGEAVKEARTDFKAGHLDPMKAVSLWATVSGIHSLREGIKRQLGRQAKKRKSQPEE